MPSARGGVHPRARRRSGGTRATPLLLLNLPLVALLVGVVAYPMGYSFWLSLHDYNLQRPASYGFVGLRNYARLTGASEFWASLHVTLVFVAATVVLNLLLGLGLALVANSSLRGRTALRTLLVLPWAIPAIVNGLMWQWMFNGQVGVINGLLRALHVIDEYRSWLSDPIWALAILVIAHVWNFTPFTAIFLLAALQAIPAELYEAAAVDGANPGRRFRHVTLPWLASALLVVMLLQTIYSLRVFDIVYVLTGGGLGTLRTSCRGRPTTRRLPR